MIVAILVFTLSLTQERQTMHFIKSANCVLACSQALLCCQHIQAHTPGYIVLVFDEYQNVKEEIICYESCFIIPSSNQFNQSTPPQFPTTPPPVLVTWPWPTT